MCHETISIHRCTHEETQQEYCNTTQQHTPTSSTWILDTPCSRCSSTHAPSFSDLLHSVARIRATVDECIPPLIHRLDTAIGMYQWYQGQERQMEEARGYAAQLGLLRAEARECEGVVGATCARHAELASAISACEDAGVEVRRAVYDEFERVEVGLGGIAGQIALGVDVLVIMERAEAVVDRLAEGARAFMMKMSSNDAVAGAQRDETVVDGSASRAVAIQVRTCTAERLDSDVVSGAQEG